MKKLTSAKVLLVLSLLFATLLFACKEDNPPEPPPPTTGETGLFVYGTNSIASKPGSDASRMGLAILDPGKGSMVDSIDGIYGKFMHIGANSTLTVAYLDNGAEKAYGASGGGSLDSASAVGGEFEDRVINGTLAENSDPIQVTNEGLYYLYINWPTKKFILMEVKANIIGDATEFGWTSGTPLPLFSSDTNGTVFEGTGIPLMGSAGYRYRFNAGWHVYRDNNVVTLSSLGVPDYGVAWSNGVNDIGFHLDNAPQIESGTYTIRLTYDAKTGEWDEVKTRTGDIMVDYANVEIGWFGNAYYDVDSTEGAWDTIDWARKPEKNGNIYEWKWTMELIPSRSFVLRENSASGEWITFSVPTRLGTAFTDDLIIKEAAQDNFYVVTGGVYEVTYTINTDDGTKTLTIEP